MSRMSIPPMPVEVFYSFSKADAPLLNQLEYHLSVLRQEGLIAPWHRREIAVGSDWMVELDQHLNTASLILLLISPNFLASDYLYGVELQRAMQRSNANEARIIPIILRPCDWTHMPFSKLRAVPRNEKAVTSWRNRDEAFAEIVKEIRVALADIQQLTDKFSSAALPTWNVPYRRNSHFTGRDEVL